MSGSPSPSPSPSPAPEVPTQLVPGPRATALSKIYASALRATLSTNSYANFSSCFPTPAKYCPTALEGVWRQLNARLEEECLKDFEKICEERQVVKGLNEWDRAVEEARERRAASTATNSNSEETAQKALHTLSADELYTARITPYLISAESELNRRLQTSQDENQQMMEKVHRQREEMQSLLAQLDGMVQDVESGAEMLDAELKDKNLRADVMEIERELQASKT